MKPLLALLLSAPLLGATTPPAGWSRLLDKNLSQWRTYESYRHQPGYKGQVPTTAQGQPLPPIGYDKDEAHVFTVEMQQGEPVLRIRVRFTAACSLSKTTPTTTSSCK